METAHRIFFFVPIVLQMEKKATPAAKVRAYLVAAAWLLACFAVGMHFVADIAAWIFLIILELLILLFSTLTLFSLQSVHEGSSPAEAERLVNPLQEVSAAFRVLQLLSLVELGAFWTGFLVLFPAVSHDVYRWRRGELYIDETTIWRERKVQEWAGLTRFALDGFGFVWLLTLLVMSTINGEI
jgi:hypothetical protein